MTIILRVYFINKLIYSFLWNSQDRIKRNVLIYPIEYGSIGIVDVETKLKALKACWVSRTIKPGSKILEFFNSFLNVFDVNVAYLLQTCETKLSDFDIVHKLPRFYQEVFAFFNSCKKNLEYTHSYFCRYILSTDNIE